MLEVPNIRFFVNKNVNLFYHTCVLFSEYFPDEYSFGILNNSAYKQQHQGFKTEGLHRRFQHLLRYSFYTWDYVGKSLFQVHNTTSIKETLEETSSKLADIWAEILSEAMTQYDSTWTQIEAKLEEYKAKFEIEWNLVSESVLVKMANIARLPWKAKFVKAHLVDCVYGAESWVEDIVLPPFPIFDIEKKLFAHELAHILVPEYFLRTKLETLGLDHSISHTIVDLIAYFGVKDHVEDSERKGIKPNPNYYVQVPRLYPIFENCNKNPNQYQSFDDILNQIKLSKE